MPCGATFDPARGRFFISHRDRHLKIKDDLLSTTISRQTYREPLPADRPDLGSVLVACPDARPPAYEAVVGLAKAGLLARFVTGFYHGGHGPALELTRQFLPCQFARLRRALHKRHDRRIPAARVESAWSFDAALAIENRMAGRSPRVQHASARWRTRRFDRIVADAIERHRPEAALLFSDVGTEHALPTCRKLGIPSVLSMVHGDVREEREVLEREAAEAPDFFPLYLGDGRLDRDALDWLHERRLRDIERADRILVPSDHIAESLSRHGTPRGRISVIPYAADTRRFKPLPNKRHGQGCKFLFAGGITQRKGIKYLLEAWRMVRRPGWTLQLLGALPAHLGPLERYLGDVEHLGRVAHSEMPARMADADVFVFPSLFEGSAVVTYEALACGLPSLVTPESGSVVRDGVDGLIVPSRDVETLARGMERLGSDPALREKMAASARSRAEDFGWPRYQAALIAALGATAARVE
jgi:alpha-maltose-1-phosphate synthase